MGSHADKGIIMVAVSKHASSIQAVKWTLANKIVARGSTLKLVHVQPSLRFIPTPTGSLVPEHKLNPDIVATFRRDLHSKTKQDLQAQLNLCDAAQVQAELVIVEGDDIANSLLDQALKLGAKKFIIGKSSKAFFRKLKGPRIPDIVEEKAPKFCTVFVIENGKLLSLKAARGSSHSSVASSTSAHIRNNDCNFSDVSSGTISHSDCSSSSFSASEASTEASISNVSVVVKEDSHSQRGVFFDLNKLKLEYEQRILKAEKAASIAARNATRSDAYAKEEARKREQAMVEAQVARQELAMQARALEAARLAREEEAERRREAEDRANQLESTSEEVLAVLQQAKTKYREYDFEELKIATNGFSEENKIGRGGYGFVYKGRLHHTTVAIKVLDKQSIQGLKEFQQEVEFLSRMRHPHLVLLLGACPEQGCLVYEYLANGSLEDRLRCSGNTAPLPWQTRFRIPAEVATALLFLHSLKPNPYVHRDLKPGNILLDQNYASKLGDVGLAALAPSVISYDVTQYRETIPVGTPTYIDPAYQTTGVFTPRSDVFAFGIIALQLLTGEGPFGLPAMVEVALNQDTFEKVLDPAAGNWPVHEAAELAHIALRCTKLEPSQRTDIKVVLPQLEKLATFANDYIAQTALSKQGIPEATWDIPSNFVCPISKEIMENPHFAADGFTYELAAIQKWLEGHKISPKTNMKLQHKHLIPNHNLRVQILEWKQQRLPYARACPM